MKRLFDAFKALPKLQKVEILMAVILGAYGMAVVSINAFSMAASADYSNTKNGIGFVSGMIFAVMGFVMLAANRASKIDHRLRGLAEYVEELRAYTVPKIDSIEDFLERNSREEEIPPPPTTVPTELAIEKPLGTRERDTLLTIIAVLAKEAKLQIDQPGKTALYIEGLTNELGAPVSKRAIEDHLKKIPNALETRMK